MKKLNEMAIVAGGSCGGGTCPTLYKSEDGRYFIQGYRTEDSIADKTNIPLNEDVVEISEQLLIEIKNFTND